MHTGVVITNQPPFIQRQTRLKRKLQPAGVTCVTFDPLGMNGTRLDQMAHQRPTA